MLITFSHRTLFELFEDVCRQILKSTYDIHETTLHIVSLTPSKFHDDTGCAVANAFTALEAGATRKLTVVLGFPNSQG
jgi:homocitrate synthase